MAARCWENKEKVIHNNGCWSSILEAFDLLGATSIKWTSALRISKKRLRFGQGWAQLKSQPSFIHAMLVHFGITQQSAN
jgi:hypothetical protein